jgi:hypothetical protein
MAFEVLRTPQVRDAVARMSRTERAGYEAARDELGGRGCVAGGYKLAATDGGDYPVCARHLANAWRMYTGKLVRAWHVQGGAVSAWDRAAGAPGRMGRAHGLPSSTVVRGTKTPPAKRTTVLPRRASGQSSTAACISGSPDRFAVQWRCAKTFGDIQRRIQRCRSGRGQSEPQTGRGER